MELTACPEPKLSEALAPFIKSRQEVSAIRQALHAQLESQLCLEKDNHLTISNLGNTEVKNPAYDRNGLSGVRQAYINALEANRAAQAKLEALKIEVQELNPSGTVHQRSGSESLPTAHLMLLLRQRERMRRLKVLKGAYNEIEQQASRNASIHLDDLVEDSIGTQPLLPTTQATGSEKLAEVEEIVLDLKKATLKTKRKLDLMKVDDEAAVGRDHTESSQDAKLYALKQAHTFMVKWVEDRLASISQVGLAHQETEEDHTTLMGEEKPRICEAKEIQSMYQSYLDARQRLVQAVGSSPSQSAGPADVSTRQRETSLLQHTVAKVPPSVVVLPYVRALSSYKQEAAALQEQSSFARRQLATSDDAAARLLKRLADESHLVQYGALSGQDWRNAAADMGQTDKDLISEYLELGNTSATEASRTLVNIGEIPKALELMAKSTAS
ncbi:hypothetical protein K431DRAFT_301833 [Polychaeton citri CBS 116435]|uniref:Uncharacterized protein n=1 Tax=Polychaeton citri CBS 116435 TaxID=1314669 RepID=A0A9P4QB98_9PEZI|nr:hypothetical protein K431DRAFT_301833 [Polychaeton citri CBS 116435]